MAIGLTPPLLLMTGAFFGILSVDRAAGERGHVRRSREAADAGTTPSGGGLQGIRQRRRGSLLRVQGPGISGFIQQGLRRVWDVTPDGRLLMLFRDGPRLEVVANVMNRRQPQGQASR